MYVYSCGGKFIDCYMYMVYSYFFCVTSTLDNLLTYPCTCTCIYVNYMYTCKSTLSNCPCYGQLARHLFISLLVFPALPALDVLPVPLYCDYILYTVLCVVAMGPRHVLTVHCTFVSTQPCLECVCAHIRRHGTNPCPGSGCKFSTTRN